MAGLVSQDSWRVCGGCPLRCRPRSRWREGGVTSLSLWIIKRLAAGKERVGNYFGCLPSRHMGVGAEVGPVFCFPAWLARPATWVSSNDTCDRQCLYPPPEGGARRGILEGPQPRWWIRQCRGYRYDLGRLSSSHIGVGAEVRPVSWRHTWLAWTTTRIAADDVPGRQPLYPDVEGGVDRNFFERLLRMRLLVTG
jgi:hypothetical protein